MSEKDKPFVYEAWKQDRLQILAEISNMEEALRLFDIMENDPYLPDWTEEDIVRLVDQEILGKRLGGVE